MNLFATRYKLSAAALFTLALILCWLAYVPALSGSFLFDDEWNLGGLRSVEDTTSALQFVFSGSAGPIGRPIALASFLPQAADFDRSPEPFLAINVILHLLNACLVAFLLYRLSVERSIDDRKAAFAAVSAATIWLLMPLLASTSLMVVQRMTSLSATFVLLGLIGYLLARQGLDSNPRRSLVGMSTALIVGTLLAVLTKENGALLPTFALVLEMTVLTRPNSVRASHWRAWAFVFLLVPTMLLAAYLALQLPYPETTTLRRGFNGWERLLTESHILWEYLYNAFVPRSSALGPFHDGHPVARTLKDPVTFLACFSWIAIIAFAMVRRRRFPLFCLGVLWYIAGHAIESTTIPLELYFEHRNYLPLIGPVYALCAATALAPSSTRLPILGGMAFYIMVNAFVLHGYAGLWGNPALAAHQWRQEFPNSVRATLKFITTPTSTDWTQPALETLGEFIKEHPDKGYLRILELDFACALRPSTDHRRLASEAERALGDVEFSYNAITMLSNLYTTVERVRCPGLSAATVRSLANSLKHNKRYRSNERYNQLHHKLMARLSRDDGRYDDAINHIKKGIGYRPDPDLNMMMVTTLADARRFDEADAFIKEARTNAPLHPFRRYVWLSRLNDLQAYVDAVEQSLVSGLMELR